MADEVSIELEHTKRSDTQHALWTAVLYSTIGTVLVAAESPRLGRRETGLRAPMAPSML